MRKGPRSRGGEPSRRRWGLHLPKLTQPLQLPSTSTRAWASTAVPGGETAFQLTHISSNSGIGMGALV